MFVDRNNFVYGTEHDNNTRIYVFNSNRISESSSIKVSLYSRTDIFVNADGDIYFESSLLAGRIEKWSKLSNQINFVFNFGGHCYGLFIDDNNYLYCSMLSQHKVVKVSLDNTNALVILVAGNGTSGKATRQLSSPWAIFVDHNFNLYVADTGNQRIQKFARDQINAVTLFGRSTSSISGPGALTDVISDGNDFLYFPDHSNGIIRWKNNQYSCVVDCAPRVRRSTGENYYAISLDSYGNFYLLDRHYSPLYMYNLIDDGCSQYYPCKRFSSKSYFDILDDFSATIKIDPSGSLLTFETTQEIYFTSEIFWNGTFTSFYQLEWFLYQFDDINCSEVSIANKSINNDSLEFSLSPHILSIGIYELIVIMNTKQNTKIHSSSVIFQIVSSDIELKIMASNLASINHSVQDELELYPGLYDSNSSNMISQSEVNRFVCSFHFR